MNVILVVLIIFWSIPMNAALSLANISNLSSVPGLGPLLLWVVGLDSFIKGYIEGLIPALMILIFYRLIVPILRLMTRFECIRSRSKVEIATEKKFVALLFINIFAQSLLAGTFLSIADQLWQFTERPLEIINLLAVKIPAQVNFFIEFVLANSVIAYMVVLWRPFDLLKTYFVRCRAKSSRDIYRAYRRTQFDYANRIGHDMLIFLIVLTFSAIAPIILIFGVLYYIVAYLVDFYNILYIHRNRAEGHGNYWPALFGQICIALFIYQICLVGILALVGFWGTLALVPLPISTIVFYVITRQTFFHRSKVGSFDLETQDFKISEKEMRLAYRHPALTPLDIQERYDDLEERDEVEDFLIFK
jgi:hypothetical protein